MKIIDTRKYHEYFNQLTVNGKKYWDLPNLLCVKCQSLIGITVHHAPDRLQIVDCSCKP